VVSLKDENAARVRRWTALQGAATTRIPAGAVTWVKAGPLLSTEITFFWIERYCRVKKSAVMCRSFVLRTYLAF